MTQRTPGKRLAVRFAVIAAAAVALLVGAALLLPVLVDVNGYRGVIQSKAEEAIGRRVTLGRMSLTVLPAFGIRVEDPEVEGLLAARSLTVGARLLPLLFGGEIVLSRVLLDHPEITLERREDGTWDLARAGPAPSTEGDQETGEASGAFTLARLSIDGGVVRLKSPGSGGRAPAAIDVGLDLNASIEASGGGDLEATFAGDLSAKGIFLDVSGEVTRRGPDLVLSVAVERSNLEIARARDLIAAVGRPWPLPDGVLRSEAVQVSGRLKAVAGPTGLRSASLEDVVLSGADVAIARDRRGRWNVLSVGAPATGGGGPGRGAATDLRVANLRVSGASVSLHDEAASPSGGAADLAFSEVDLTLDRFEPGSPVTFGLQARMDPGRGTVRIDGTLPLSVQGSAPSPVDARVELGAIDVGAIAPYLRALLGVEASSGAIALEAQVAGEYPARIDLSGSLSLDAVRVEGAASPVTAAADFDITATDAARAVGIRRLAVAFGGSRMETRGTIDNSGSGTVADIEIPPATVEAGDLTGLLAVTGVDLPVMFAAARPVRLQARIRGDLKAPDGLDLAGRIEVEGATLKHPSMDRPLEDLRGTVTLRRDGFDVSGFSGVIGGSDVSGSMTVADFDAPRVGFALTSRQADFGELTSFLDAGDSEGGGAPSKGSGGGESLLPRLTAAGTLAIGKGTFGALSFGNLECRLSLERQVLRLDPVSMTLYGGTMNGAASMDMGREPAVYTVTARTADVDTNALLTANLGMKDMLSGALGADLSITTAGAGLAGLVEAARGSGSVRIENGRVGAINVLKILSRASGVLGERSLKEVSARLAKEGTDFSLLTADLKVSAGTISSDNLTLESPDLALKDDGSLDMMNATISIEGEVVFSEALSRAMAEEKSRAAEIFWDDRRGRVALPLTMAGPLDAPTPGIDWQAAGGRIAKRRVEEGIRGRLEEAGLGGLIGERRQPTRSLTQDPVPPVGDRAGDARAGDLSVTIEETALSGSILLRDLKVKARVAGTGIAAVRIVVTDEEGRAVHDESLMKKVEKYYETHERSAPASILFRVTVEGKRLVAVKGDLEITITASDASGREATRSATVTR